VILASQERNEEPERGTKPNSTRHVVETNAQRGTREQFPEARL